MPVLILRSARSRLRKVCRELDEMIAEIVVIVQSGAIFECMCVPTNNAGGRSSETRIRGDLVDGREISNVRIQIDLGRIQRKGI